MARYVAKWIAPLAKSAGVTAEALYSLFNHRGYHAPYDDEYKGLTLVRANGRKCMGYRPTENAAGKPLPPLIKKGKGKKDAKLNGAHAGATWGDKNLLSRLAKLLPGGPDTKTKGRIRYYLKQAGHTEVRKMDEGAALAILEGRGININGFEYARPPGTPGSAKLVPDPAGTHELLLTQYAELGTQLQETSDRVAARDATIGALKRERVAVRQILKQYHDMLWAVGRERFGEITSPLEYPLTAYSLLLKQIKGLVD